MNTTRTMLITAGVAGDAARREGLGARQGRDIRHAARRVRRIPRGSPWTARATSTSSPWRRTNPGRAREHCSCSTRKGKHLRTVAHRRLEQVAARPPLPSADGPVARDRLQGREGPERRSQDGRLVRVHDGHGQEPRPRRDDVRRRRQRVRDRRPPGHHLESRTQTAAKRRPGSRARCSSRRGLRPPSARTVWRSTTSRRRCSSPTRRTTRSSRYR